MPSHTQIFGDPALEKDFRRFGYAVGRLFDEEICRDLLAGYRNLPVPRGLGFHATIYHNDVPLRTAVDALLRPVMEVAIRRQLIDYRPLILAFMVKEPGRDDSALVLHQDWMFVEEPESVSVHIWCPLVPVNAANGSLAVVPGTHAMAPAPRVFGDPCPFQSQFGRIWDRYAIELDLSPGEAVFADSRLLHGSRPNRSAAPRIATSAVAVPVAAPLLHLVRAKDGTARQFRADDAFFREYPLGRIPDGESIPRDCSPPRLFREDEVDALAEFVREAPRGSSRR